MQNFRFGYARETASAGDAFGLTYRWTAPTIGNEVIQGPVSIHTTASPFVVLAIQFGSGNKTTNTKPSWSSGLVKKSMTLLRDVLARL